MDSSQGVSLATLGVAAVLLLNYLFSEPTPQSTRPLNGATVEQLNSHSQDIPARLWQDPFEAVNAARERERAKPKSASDASGPGTSGASGTPGTFGTSSGEPAARRPTRFDVLVDDIETRDRTGDIVIMPIIASGGNYPEAEEHRRRTRYAVVSALIRSGFNPEQAGHLGYALDPERAAEDAVRLPRERRQRVYPYEWFSNQDLENPEAVLLVWVNEDLLGDEPIATIASWQRRLRDAVGQRAGAIALRIIGAFGSGALLNMSRELSEWSTAADVPEPVASGMRGINLFAPLATIEERLLDRFEGSGLTLSQRWARRLPDSQLIRVTNTDRELLDEVLTELDGRGVNPDCLQWGLDCDHVVLISESDSLYGRSLPDSFVVAGGFVGAGTIHQFSYLRGLDGRVPGVAPAADPAIARDKATGQGQLSLGDARVDYLERLAEWLEALDLDLRNRMQGRLRAVGVLGSDLYDKLMILQALKPRLPGVVFFTTDLDARMLDEMSFKWTRNLVVVSDFGLQLDRGLQGGAPPFRGSYQTGTYLATLIALRHETRSEGLAAQLAESMSPRLFEVGRGRAFELPLQRGKKLSPELYAGLTEMSPTRYRVHPLYFDPSQSPYFLHWWKIIAVVSLLLVTVTLANVSALQRGIAGFRNEILQKHSGRTIVFTLVLTGYAGVMVAAWAFSAHFGEPWSWTGGVSAWPGEVMRLIAGVLAVVLLWRTLVGFDDTRAYLEKEYIFGHEPAAQEAIGWRAAFAATWRGTTGLVVHPVSATMRIGYRSVPPLKRWARRLRRRPAAGARLVWRRVCWFFCLQHHLTPYQRSEDAAGEVDAVSHWNAYLDRGRPAYRWTRVLLPTALFLLAGNLIINQVSGSPPVPVRTAAMAALDKVIIVGLTVVPFLLLLFTIVDASRNSVMLMRGLQAGPTCWPALPVGCRHRMTEGHRYAGDDLGDWMNVRFSADLTEQLGRTVYFPFVIIFLMLISRLTYFDGWVVPVGLLVIVGLSASYAIYCSGALQVAARSMREQALKDLTMRRDRLRADAASTDSPETRNALEARLTQIGELEQAITDIRDGAFRVWHQQPVIKALMLLLSSVSIFAIDLVNRL